MQVAITIHHTSMINMMMTCGEARIEEEKKLYGGWKRQVIRLMDVHMAFIWSSFLLQFILFM